MGELLKACVYCWLGSNSEVSKCSYDSGHSMCSYART